MVKRRTKIKDMRGKWVSIISQKIKIDWCDKYGHVTVRRGLVDSGGLRNRGKMTVLGELPARSPI